MLSVENGAEALSPCMTRADLAWWLEQSPSLEWIWAKTYAESAPHDYVVLGRTTGLTRHEFVRAGAVIRTFGQPGKFYESTNIYLESGGLKYWTMDARVKDTTLINRASTERVYGVQDAPSTYTGRFTEFDGIAADYDLRRNSSHDAQLAERIVGHFGGRQPRTLDVGCGSGALLSLGMVRPSDYTGVDPSQGMLNELVLRYPDVDRVFPGTLDEFMRTGSVEAYDLVVVQGVPGVDIGTLRVNPGGLLLVVDDAEGVRL